MCGSYNSHTYLINKECIKDYMLDSLFYLKLFGVDTYMFKTKKNILKAETLLSLNNVNGWVYTYILPSTQNIEDNNIIIVGFLEPLQKNVIEKFFHEFGFHCVICDKNQILKEFLTEINLENVDLNDHLCEWANQIFVGEFLDTYLSLYNSEFPHTWKKPLHAKSVEKNWNVIWDNFNFWKTYTLETITSKDSRELLLLDATPFYEKVWKES